MNSLRRTLVWKNEADTFELWIGNNLVRIFYNYYKQNLFHQGSAASNLISYSAHEKKVVV
jgi:hypothetical protein